MKYFAIVTILYTVFASFAIMLATPVQAIVIIAPMLFGFGQIIALVMAIATVPVTLISVFVNIDKYKKDRKTFLLFTVTTWIVLLFLIALVTALIYYFAKL